jgi:GTP-binding protein
MQLQRKTPQFVFFANMPQYVKEPTNVTLKIKLEKLGLSGFQLIFILEKYLETTL